jgi:hypothetical protein
MNTIFVFLAGFAFGAAIHAYGFERLKDQIVSLLSKEPKAPEESEALEESGESEEDPPQSGNSV